MQRISPVRESDGLLIPAGSDCTIVAHPRILDASAAKALFLAPMNPILCLCVNLQLPV